MSTLNTQQECNKDHPNSSVDDLDEKLDNPAHHCSHLKRTEQAKNSTDSKEELPSASGFDHQSAPELENQPRAGQPILVSDGVTTYPSLPTPPYTPASLHQNNSSATYFTNNNYDREHFPAANIEVNNNMDMNSNDQEFEQYSQFHQQHYLEQQRSRNEHHDEVTSRNNSHAASVNHSQQLNSRRYSYPHDLLENYSRPSRELSSVGDVTTSTSMVAADEPSEAVSPNPQSVRPRTANYSNAHRRVSHNALSSPHHQLSHYSHGRTGPHERDFTPGMGGSTSMSSNSDQRDLTSEPRDAHYSGLPTLPPPRDFMHYHDGHPPHDMEGHPTALESATELPTLPRPPNYSSGGEHPRRDSLDGCTEAERREAQLLLYQFTQDQLARERLSLPQDLAHHQGLQEHNLLRSGSELRRLADAFADTAERRKVRLMAEDVCISAITWENFASLCMELFSGPRGITAERIVALFTFIADIALVEIRRGAESCIRKLMAWSLKFLFERVCQWVHRAGGWGRVLNRGLDVVYKVAMSAAAVVAIAAMAVYITKTVKHL